MRFKQKVVMVIGGASGIGRECCRLFAREGAIIVVADINKPLIDSLVDELIASGTIVEGFWIDLTDTERLIHIFSQIEQTKGGVDILVNAASTLLLKTIEHTSLEEWQKIIAINATGTFLACKLAIKCMKKRKGGSIINFSSSTGAYDAGKSAVAYIASKGCVTMLTKALAVDHAQDKIRINAVAPGPTDTPMLRSLMNDEAIEAFGQTLPIKRMGTPSEIAQTVLFLASEEASFVTGAILAVDGGQTADIS